VRYFRFQARIEAFRVPMNRRVRIHFRACSGALDFARSSGFLVSAGSRKKMLRSGTKSAGSAISADRSGRWIMEIIQPITSISSHFHTAEIGCFEEIQRDFSRVKIMKSRSRWHESWKFFDRHATTRKILDTADSECTYFSHYLVTRHHFIPCLLRNYGH
jgi:hypothetical protein